MVMVAVCNGRENSYIINKKRNKYTIVMHKFIIFFLAGISFQSRKHVHFNFENRSRNDVRNCFYNVKEVNINT